MSIWREFNLLRESNVAVWWSGLCLLMSGLLFFRLGSRFAASAADRFMWIILALVALALSIDEIGSLHERVALFGGWWALLPFGVVLVAAFAYAIARCLSLRRYRPTGVLFVASLALFAGVAAMEHLFNSKRLPEIPMPALYLVAEEGMEQLAEILLILAGVLAISRNASIRLRAVSAVVDPARLWAIREWLYAALALHLCATVLWMPYLINREMGNPAYWYPMLVFVLVAFHCMHRYGAGGGFAWLAGVPLFLLLSIGQVQDMGLLVNRGALPLRDALFDSLGAQALWMIVPTTLFIALHVRTAALAGHVALGVGLVVLLRNGGEVFETYYILSGVYALLCFNTLVSPAVEDAATDAWSARRPPSTKHPAAT